mgnify:CR=1 FL=1
MKTTEFGEMASKEQVQYQIRPTGVLNEADTETVDGALAKPEVKIAKKRKYEIVWRNVILMSVLHVFALYGIWLMLSGQTKWQTMLFSKKLISSVR